MTTPNSATPSMSAARISARRLDAARRFRLARHALDGLATDAADADAGADDGETGAETGADGHHAARARDARVSGRLEHGKDRVRHGAISKVVLLVKRQRPAASPRRRPSPRPGSQRTSPVTRPGT